MAGTLLLGAIALGLALSLDGDEPDEVATSGETVATAPEPATESEPHGQTASAAAAWTQRLRHVEALAEEWPQVTIHRLQAYTNGTLALECSQSGSNLRQVAGFREALKHNPLGEDAVLHGSSVRILQHETCELHGDVSDISRFTVELRPSAPAEVVSGSLQLVSRCTATH